MIELKAIKVCETCGASFTIDKTKEYLVCQHCDFKVKTENLLHNKKIRTVGKNLVEKYFTLSKKEGKDFTKNNLETLDTICEYLEKDLSYDEFLEVLVDMSYTNSHMASYYSNIDLYDRMLDRMADYLDEDEEILYCEEETLFGKKIKDAIIITNKNFYVISKKHTYYIELAEFNEFIVCRGRWYLATETTYSSKFIGTVNITPKELGIVFAFVCSMARLENGQNYQFKLRII